jgi:hypothetical protein
LIEHKIEKHLTSAYNRAFVERISRVQNVEKAEGEIKSKVIQALLKNIKNNFLDYAEKTAIPTVKATLKSLLGISGIEQQVNTIARNSKRVILDSIQNIGNKVINFGVLTAARNASIHSVNQIETSRRLKQILENRLAGIHKGTDPTLYLTARLSAARAYNFAFLDWARRNSITEYYIVPFQDNKTCAACLSMNGKAFSIEDAVDYRDRFLEASDDPELLRKEFSFLTPRAVQNISESDIDGPGDGKFYFPPFHPHCRCICVAKYEISA